MTAVVFPPAVYVCHRRYCLPTGFVEIVDPSMVKAADAAAAEQDAQVDPAAGNQQGLGVAFGGLRVVSAFCWMKCV